MNVFITVNLLSVVIGHESAAHASDLELKGVFDEGSPDQIVVLPLEALKIAPHCVDGIVFVELPVLHIVSNGTSSSCLNLKDKGVSVIIDVSAVNLRSEQYVVVDCAVTIVALWFLLHHFGFHDLVDRFPWMCEQILSESSQLHQNFIDLLLTVSFIRIN